MSVLTKILINNTVNRYDHKFTNFGSNFMSRGTSSHYSIQNDLEFDDMEDEREHPLEPFRFTKAMTSILNLAPQDRLILIWMFCPACGYSRGRCFCRGMGFE